MDAGSDRRNLVFLKLGGSLITDKDQERTARPEVIRRLAAEIAQARQETPGLQIVLGHGSGSFGHSAARKHGTRAGVYNQQEWRGFAEVWYQARALNQIIIELLVEAGLPVVAFPPSACLFARDGKPLLPDLVPFQAALHAGLIPVVNGDAVFDAIRGGTILSTEDVFVALAAVLRPARILLAGLEKGVYADFPACQHLLPELTPLSLEINRSGIQGSASVDVTGGMRQKVDEMLALAQQIPGLEALIFSGLEPGSLCEALLGAQPGTRIHA